VIAPLPQTDPRSARPSRLHQAHRLIVATLLKHRSQAADHRPPIPAWKAWLLTAWVVLTTGVYLLAMSGRF